MLVSSLCGFANLRHSADRCFWAVIFRRRFYWTASWPWHPHKRFCALFRVSVSSDIPSSPQALCDVNFRINKVLSCAWFQASAAKKRRTKGQESEGHSNSWPLKMGPIGCPETSVRNCHYYLNNSPEECVSQGSPLFCNQNLISAFTDMDLQSFFIHYSLLLENITLNNFTSSHTSKSEFQNECESRDCTITSFYLRLKYCKACSWRGFDVLF